jgi:hypothetical protein
MPNISTGKLGRQQMILIARCGGFTETKGDAVATFYLVPQLLNPGGFNF